MSDADQPTGSTTGPTPGGDHEPLGPELERLRSAAREVISATRGLLDAVEDVLADDERLRGVAQGVGDAVKSVSEAVTDAVRGLGGRRTPPGTDPTPPEPHVEHIVVE